MKKLKVLTIYYLIDLIEEEFERDKHKNLYENNHITILSQLGGEYYLDKIVNKIINLLLKVLEDEECFKDKNSSELKQLIGNNCAYMILFDLAENKEYFTEEYINYISEYLPFNIEYCNTLKENINKRVEGIKLKNNLDRDEIVLEFIGYY